MSKDQFEVTGTDSNGKAVSATGATEEAALQSWVAKSKMSPHGLDVMIKRNGEVHDPALAHHTAIAAAIEKAD